MPNKLMTAISNNKEAICRRVLIVGGTVAGIFIAGALLNKIVPSEVLIVETTEETSA